MITNQHCDSYRKAIETFRVLLGLQLVLFKLLLLWCQLAMMVKPG